VAANPPELGLIASFRRALATLLTLIHTRLELAAVELEEQIEHAAGVLLWSIAAIFFGGLAVLVLALTIVIAFWDEHRLLAASLVTLGFALAAVIAALVVRSRLRHRPRFLSATAAELRADSAALRGEQQ
jgi:uncharacterized membrane protein YqjE